MSEEPASYANLELTLKGLEKGSEVQRNENVR